MNSSNKFQNLPAVLDFQEYSRYLSDSSSAIWNNSCSGRRADFIFSDTQSPVFLSDHTKNLDTEYLLKKREDQDPPLLSREGDFLFSKARAKVITLKIIFKWEREEEKWGSSTFGANLFLLSACHHMSLMLEAETNTLSKYFRHLLLK